MKCLLTFYFEDQRKLLKNEILRIDINDGTQVMEFEDVEDEIKIQDDNPFDPSPCIKIELVEKITIGILTKLTNERILNSIEYSIDRKLNCTQTIKHKNYFLGDYFTHTAIKYETSNFVIPSINNILECVLCNDIFTPIDLSIYFEKYNDTHQNHKLEIFSILPLDDNIVIYYRKVEEK